MINITEKPKCCGCAGCVNICAVKAITMKADHEGFLYPHVDEEKCTQCGLCDSVCPVINVKPETVIEQAAFLIQHNDLDIRKESTSGGAFTAIAKNVLDKSGVVFGAGFNDDFVVVHQMVETIDGLKKFRNSKYVQSEIGETFTIAKHFLNEGRLVLFSGTPCQIEGLLQYLRKPFDNLITVDFVCRAVPSPLVWEKYKKMRSKNRTIQSALFRDKNPYGYNYSQISMKFKDENIYFGVESDPYLRAFFDNISDRPSCYECRFKKRYRTSDITLWDCYNVHKFSKDFDEDGGTTRALVHSQKGKDIISAISGTCNILAIGPDDAVEGVYEIGKSTDYNPKHVAFFEDINAMSVEGFFKKYFPDTMKIKAERCIRRSCYKFGIYNAAKTIYIRLMKK